MIAEIVAVPEGFTATFVFHYKHSVDTVWAMLTQNELLKEWFSELRVKDLRTGGIIEFDMRDGTFLELEITDFERNSVLEFIWGEDKVRFELLPEREGCRLQLIETMGKITDHTAKDLSGWHVCLEVIAALLDGKPFGNRKRVWENRYEVYSALVDKYYHS
ncbi:SRPBCC family protein [Paenibacillus sp. sgz500992]|uniref:SRPBCC family protein n=1 Tax=Paenibacillus sp. sgz500992 TaxID=3242476 RepID=UPI0036D43855